MAKAYSFETRERAEVLYVEQGLTYKQVAKETRVSESQLRTWAKDEDWRARREEHLKRKHTLKVRMRELKLSLLEKALDGLDPKHINAALRMEELSRKYGMESGDVDRPALFLEFLKLVTETLKRVDPKAVAVIERNYDAIIEAFKSEEKA